MKKYFVTGTDTDIGKTIVSTLLAMALKAKYWKPIQSGLTPETDSDFVKKYLPLENIIPERYLLTQPLSPHLSARLDKVEIQMQDFQLPQVESSLIVEGAGGIFVPINKKDMIIDLIEKFQLPTLVVAKSGLGTINHTLLTLSALKQRNINVAGVIMNGPKNLENKKAIEKYGDTPVLFELETLASLSVTELQSYCQIILKEL